MVKQLGADASYYGLLQSSFSALQLAGGLLSGGREGRGSTCLLAACNNRSHELLSACWLVVPACNNRGLMNWISSVQCTQTASDSKPPRSGAADVAAAVSLHAAAAAAVAAAACCHHQQYQHQPPPPGPLVDRYGGRALLLLSLGFSALCYVLTATATSIHMLLVSRCGGEGEGGRRACHTS